MVFPDYAWVVIPVYNHAETVKEVVRGVLQHGSRVVVVDDGSSDADIAELLKDTGVTVLTHPQNCGKGAALRTAAAYLKTQAAVYMVTLDADGQHDPADLPKFLPYLGQEARNIVVGNRTFVSENVPERSKFGRRFSNFWIWLETGQQVQDTQSGFRAYPVSLLTDIRCISQYYAYETEILVRGCWAGLNIINVEISVFYPERKKRVSHFRYFRDNLRISLLHSRLLGRRMLLIPPKKVF